MENLSTLPHLLDGFLQFAVRPTDPKIAFNNANHIKSKHVVNVAQKKTIGGTEEEGKDYMTTYILFYIKTVYTVSATYLPHGQ